MIRLPCVYLAFFVSMQGLFGVVQIEEATNAPPCSPPKYVIFDLGSTEIDPSLMNPFALPHTYAPRINNDRQVSANRKDEGFLRDLHYGELVSQVGYSLKGFAFGLNNRGDCLGTVARSKANVDWFVWSQKNLKREHRYPMGCLEDVEQRDLDFRAINDDKWAVGSFSSKDLLRPLVWNPRWGIKPFGYYVGWDVKGAAWGINQQGTILGSIAESCESPPFVWNVCQGMEILRNYRIPFEAQSCHEIHGPVRFADMVITEDNYVYGTLLIDNVYYTDDGLSNYFAYRWEPYSQDFRYLDLQGMRINSVNSKHTLVGVLDGQAALRERGAKPVLLQSYLPGDAWLLLEATDINDTGDIVGYGKLNGEIHIFLMRKEQ